MKAVILETEPSRLTLDAIIENVRTSIIVCNFNFIVTMNPICVFRRISNRYVNCIAGVVFLIVCAYLWTRNDPLK